DTEGTGQVPDSAIEAGVRQVFQLTPKGIIDHLELRRPVFRKTAAYGHFGREEEGFTWELLDHVDELKSACGV
ncbi:MAG: methionine adenosyltransferase domain-containing protein, partial [Holophagales bacterium]|nr:methionine adenosyltransferase domain-containing protein [Holophagales bacterium]